MLPTTLAQPYNLNDLVRHALKKMRKYTLPNSKPNWEEDCIMNCLDTEVCRDRTYKWREIMRIEEAINAVDPSFYGFYHETRYLDRYNKFLDNFDQIMAQVPA